ncbi:hypothetical protein [Neisseria sp.]|uniref:hypothetical protein n=1 Tax=Neisseria sp. TaxID=192066 RepID=UPI0026DDC25D|nr:hypothetical protein [Neisseria sp.]MDO4907277.1 hypothetical protein [Neisseria sp.]
MKQENNFKDATFNGSTQIGDQYIKGDQYNTVHQHNYAKKQSNVDKLELYRAEPRWRNPFTLAALTWISVLLGILSLIPFGTLFFGALDSLKGVTQTNSWLYLILFMIFSAPFLIVCKLRQIAKKQIRVPLFVNYALNGKGGKLTLEKIFPCNCPKCGGEMKYYNKPSKWIDFYHPNGDLKKRKVTERFPTVECTRNPEHYWRIDPAEDKI